MRNYQTGKLFLILFICTAYIFSFSQFGAAAYDSIIHKEKSFSEGTKIGSVSVEGKSTDEAMKLVDDELTKWLEETTFTFQYKEKSVPLDLSSFHFDVKGSVLSAKHGQTNLLLAEIDPLDDFLLSISTTLNKDTIKMKELEAELLQKARMLEPGNHYIKLEPYLKDSGANKPVVINESSVELGTNENEADVLVGESIEIPGKSQFSLLSFLEEKKIKNLSISMLSKIATTIYEVILPTNFDILERHISTELPEYAALGFEAKVSSQNDLDLSFSNPNDANYVIKFEKRGGALVTKLKGPAFLYEYEIKTKDRESFEPKTVKQYNPQLNPGQVKVKEQGKAGLIIKVYRESYDENGSFIKKELLSEDFYPPVHRVEVHGLIPKKEPEKQLEVEESDEEISPEQGDQRENPEPDNASKENDRGKANE